MELEMSPLGYQKVKSNKKGCKRLARRATEIVGDIWRQTKDYGVKLPVEAQQSVEEIEKYVFPGQFCEAQIIEMPQDNP